MKRLSNVHVKFSDCIADGRLSAKGLEVMALLCEAMLDPKHCDNTGLQCTGHGIPDHDCCYVCNAIGAALQCVTEPDDAPCPRCKIGKLVVYGGIRDCLRCGYGDVR